jgi:hypothetical protein
MEGFMVLSFEMTLRSFVAASREKVHENFRAAIAVNVPAAAGTPFATADISCDDDLGRYP